MKQKDKLILKLINQYCKGRDVKVIDIGARDKVFREKLPKNAVYTSLDVDKKFKPDIVGDISKKLHIKSRTYDFLICSEVLEHIIYPRETIKELKRILKDDGMMIITLPNEYNLNLRLQFLFGVQKGCEAPFREKFWMNHIHRPRVIDAINFFKDYFKLKQVLYSWDSDKGGLSFIIDPIVRTIFMPVSKNLFTTSVIMIGTKKDEI